MLQKENVLAAATQFVDLILNDPHCVLVDFIGGSPNVLNRTTSDKKKYGDIFLEVVKEAGFNPQEISLVFRGNLWPPFRVISINGEGDMFATGWLNCLLRWMYYEGSSESLKKRSDESREELIEIVSSEIKRSIPLEPIKITREGDFLQENSPIKDSGGLAYLIDHINDDSKFVFPNHTPISIGMHKYCFGEIYVRGATISHNALVCRGCGLRSLFPNTIIRYGELRTWFLEFIGG